MVNRGILKPLVVGTATVPMVWLLTTPFLFALRSPIDGAKEMPECAVMGAVILVASGWNMLHQLFFQHNPRLGQSSPLVPQLIAFGSSAAFAAAALLYSQAPDGVADLLLTAAAVLTNGVVSLVVRYRKRQCGPDWIGLARECIVLGIVLWIVIVSQFLPHFRNHEGWAISGIGAVVALSQGFYVAELFRQDEPPDSPAPNCASSA